MTTRARRETVNLQHPVQIHGINRQLPAGAYEVVTDEEMIEGLSYPSLRRATTMIMVPSKALRRSMEMISIVLIHLADAQRREHVTWGMPGIRRPLIRTGRAVAGLVR
jgi:hypothetical protein